MPTFPPLEIDMESARPSRFGKMSEPLDARYVPAASAWVCDTGRPSDVAYPVAIGGVRPAPRTFCETAPGVQFREVAVIV